MTFTYKYLPYVHNEISFLPTKFNDAIEFPSILYIFCFRPTWRWSSWPKHVLL